MSFQMIAESCLLAQTPAGQGLETTLNHTWPFAPWIAVVVLGLAAVYVIWIYAREAQHAGRRPAALMATLRLGVVGLLVFMMYGWMQHRHVTDLPDLVLVLDVSQSMELVDHYEDRDIREQLLQQVRAAQLSEANRLNIAKSVLLGDDQQLLRTLQERYNVKLYLVGENARAQGGGEQSLAQVVAEAQPTDANSRLGNGLRDVLEAQRGRPTAAVLMFSDGIATEGTSLTDVADYARRKQVPLFLVGLGSERAPRDVRVDDLLVEELVFVGDVVHFDFKLHSTGLDEQRVLVRLRRQDDSTVLQQKTVVIDSQSGAQAVRLTHRPEQEGSFEYIVEALPLAAEVNSENNQQSALVNVRDAIIRVLLVQEYPNFEFRFLKTMLERSVKGEGPGAKKAVELTTILQEADLEYAQQDATAQRVFPVQKEELFAYDVLIFGDVNPAFLSNSLMENIAEFVKQRGGGVIFLAGPRHTPLAYRDTPLADLMPIDLSSAAVPDPGQLLSDPIRIEPTALGLTSPQLQLADTVATSGRIWRDLPPVYWLLDAPDLRPGALVLAQQRAAGSMSGRPAISMQFVGAGKVIFHALDATYRWSRYQGSDQYYERYWLQTLRYLSRSKLLGQTRAAELTTDREEYRRGDPVRVRVRFFDDRLAPPQDDGVTVVLERAAGKRRYVQLRRDATKRGIFETTVAQLPDGQYRAWLATPTLQGQPPADRFTVTAPPGEYARLEMEAEELRRAAQASAGRFYFAHQADRLPANLPVGRQVRIESLPPEPLWNSPWLAGLVVSLLVGEWLLRKRAGLL